MTFSKPIRVMPGSNSTTPSLDYLITCFFVARSCSVSRLPLVPSPKTPSRLAIYQILVIDGDREGCSAASSTPSTRPRHSMRRSPCFPESSLLGWENPDAHRLAAPIPGADGDRIGDAGAGLHDIMIAIGTRRKGRRQALRLRHSRRQNRQAPVGSTARSTCFPS